MPALETLDRHQKAVLWTKVPNTQVQYDNYGNPIVKAPVEITVRWVDGRDETVDQHGNTIAYDAKVVVNQDVPIGSTMWLGRKIDYTTSKTKLTVIHSSRTPDIKGRNYRRTLFLSRLTDTELSQA